MLILRLNHKDVCAGSGGHTCEDKTDEVGDYLKSDDPPRVGGFHSSFLSLLGVIDDLLDLLFCEFDFHTLLILTFRVQR